MIRVRFQLQILTQIQKFRITDDLDDYLFHFLLIKVIILTSKVIEITGKVVEKQVHTINSYGNTSCGVSRSGIQNPTDFCLKVKCSKGFFDIF